MFTVNLIYWFIGPLGVLLHFHQHFISSVGIISTFVKMFEDMFAVYQVDV